MLGPTSAVPVFSSPTYLDQSASVGGTISSFTGTIRVYLDGTLVGSTLLTNATTWTIPANTTYINSLYSGGALTVTAQATGSAEGAISNSTATVTCTSPVQPTITPTAATINTGQAVTFTVTNVESDTWYAVSDSSGSSYATSYYTPNANIFTLPRKAFNTAGTYNLNVTADRLTGCPLSSSSAVVTVNNQNLPVLFTSITANPFNNQMKISWTVSNEQNVDFYLVESSKDCRNFEPAGKVAFHSGTIADNRYTFTDISVSDLERICYRIKQMDNDGNYTYSAVISVNRKQRMCLSVSPNPAKERINISLASTKEQKAVIELVDMNGKLIHTESFQLHKGDNIRTLQGLRAFGHGSVVIKITTGNEIHYKKVIIE